MGGERHVSQKMTRKEPLAFVELGGGKALPAFAETDVALLKATRPGRSPSFSAPFASDALLQRTLWDRIGGAPTY